MFLLSCLLLVPMIFATEIFQINNYVVKIENVTILKSIEVISDSSEELNLSGLRLESIDDSAFENISYIKIVDLSNNSLVSLSENIFANLKNLEQLNLSDNKISYLNKPFVELSNLKVLDFSNNLITNLKASDFFGLTKSCVIFLKGNSVRNISTELFENKPSPVNHFGVTDTDHHSREVPLSAEPRNHVKICIKDSILISVEHYTVGEKLTSGCSTSAFYRRGFLYLNAFRIALFQKGWYKLRCSSIHHIDLSLNHITRLTSEMLNDLPEGISVVNLARNNIKRLENGIIVNEHLQEIDFSSNSIINIEDDVFINTNLTTLNLLRNQLTDTKFIATLPPTLTEINLKFNKIAEISRESFSSKGLTALEVLHLASNKITELNLSVFADLKNIKKIFLDSNRLWNLTRDSLINLPDSLEELDLQQNAITNLKAGIFVNSPKYKLVLNSNYISNIEDGTFNLPHLQDLDLKYNHLSVICSNMFQGLQNLRNLQLEINKITRIEKGAFKNLGNLCNLALSMNSIERLENGTLHGLSQKEGCYVKVSMVPIEMIHGGVFDSSVDSSFHRFSESNDIPLKGL